ASGQDGRRRLSRVDGVAARLRHVARTIETLIKTQRVVRRRVTVWEIQAADLSEVLQTRIAPPARFPMLDLQELSDFVEALAVDIALDTCPMIPHHRDLIHSQTVAVHELFPDASSGAEGLLPTDVVEEEQEILGHTVAACKLVAYGSEVLLHGVASARGAVEADALRVSLVIVGGVPFCAAEVTDPRCRDRKSVV